MESSVFSCGSSVGQSAGLSALQSPVMKKGLLLPLVPLVQFGGCSGSHSVSVSPGDLALGRGSAYFPSKSSRPGKCCNVVSSLQLVLGDSSSSDSTADTQILTFSAVF